jgi:dihydroxyacetone kinase-like protein
MNEIGFTDLRRMLRSAAEQVTSHASHLSELDSAIGDGDHGTTVTRSMELMLRPLDREPHDRLKSLLAKIGWEILGVNGGATGPLLGSFFTGLSEGMDERSTIDVKMLSAMFKKAEEAVLKVSGAQPGDKTLLDALVPAVSAIQAHEGSGDMIEMLNAAADAAERGAESTIGMAARKGRARNLAERSVGHKDPGATSLALLFRGFALGIDKRGA